MGLRRHGASYAWQGGRGPPSGKPIMSPPWPNALAARPLHAVLWASTGSTTASCPSPSKGHVNFVASHSSCSPGCRWMPNGGQSGTLPPLPATGT